MTNQRTPLRDRLCTAFCHEDLPECRKCDGQEQWRPMWDADATTRPNSIVWMFWFVIALLGFAAIISSQQQLTFAFDNESDYAIYEIYMSVSTDTDWGPDRLGRSVLEPGQRHVVRGLYRGRWDIKLVDEDEDVCIVSGVGVNGDEQFTITTEWLLRCESETD